MSDCEKCEMLEHLMRGDCRYCKHLECKSDEIPCIYCTLPDWGKWELKMESVQIGLSEKAKGESVSCKTILKLQKQQLAEAI